MATAELVVAFGAKIEGLEASLKRVTTELGNLQSKAVATQQGMQQSVDGMAQSWASAASSVRTFAAAFVGMKGFEIIKQGVLAVDDLNASIRRLQTITGSTPLAAESQFRSLAEIAAKTGQPVANLTEQFTRFYVATAALGTSSSTVTTLVETLANFARVSGKNLQEASAAITQLSQGLATGKLQGDELKSIMENMPLLATMLAKELGVSVGELRKMGEEGRLLAQDVVPAIIRAGAKIGEQLQALPKTIREAYQITSDRFVALIREIDKQVGASEGIANLLLAMGITAESIRVRVAGVGQGAAAEDRLINLTRQASAANEELAKVDQALQAIRSGARPDIAARPGQNRMLGLSEQELDRIKQSTINRLSSLNAQIAEVQELQGARSLSDQQRRAREGAETQVSQTRTILQELRREADGKVEIEETYRRRVQEIQRGLAAARRLGGEEQVKAERELAQGMIDATRIRNEALAREAKKEAGSTRTRATPTTTDDDKEAKAALERQRAALASANQLIQAANDPIRNLNLQFAQFTDNAGQAGSVYGNFADRVKNNNEDMALGFRAIIEKSLEAGRSLNSMGQDSAPARQAMMDEFERLATVLERAGVPIEEIRAALVQAGEDGAAAFAKLNDKADNSLNNIKQQIVNTFARDVSSTLVDFATGAEASFGKVAADFAKMVAKMILNWMILKAVTYGLKEGLGIDISAPGGKAMINPDATGAPPGPARLAGAYGEESPYFSGSASITPRVEAAGGDVTVNVINNANGTQTRQESRNNGLGGKQIDIYIEEVVHRGMMNGNFDGTMATVFGASRVGRV